MKLLILLISIFFSISLAAESPQVSPNPGWSEVQVQERTRPTVLTQILLWVPNRIADIIDVFRLDVGVGPATGVVIRISDNFQAGYRVMSPLSFRVGNFGRDYPWLIETSNEIGITPAFRQSSQRKVCGSELGVGADLLIVGGYGGICIQEVADFIAGIFFIDLNQDDWE